MFTLSVMSHEEDMETTSPLLPNEETADIDNPIINTSVQNDPDETEQQTSDTWQNKQHEIPNTVKIQPKFTGYVLLLSCLSAIGGFLFGYDTGVVAGAMLQVKNHFSLTTLWVEAIVSVTIGAAAVSALIAGFVNDCIGRKPVILIASAVFTIGAVILGVAHSKAELLIGRSILGIGIGFTSMTVPMYIAESAPAHLRGRMVTLNILFITGGQFIASVVDGLFSMDKTNGWRFMFGLAGIPSLVQLVGFVFMPESPRWLIGKGKDEKAEKILMKIRGVSNVKTEIDEIKRSCEEDARALAVLGKTPAIIQVLRIPHVRKALLIGCMLQVFQQISGINTVMYYSATIIKMSGVKSDSQAIWLSALTASMNFLFTLVGLYLVEKIGRRALTLGSLIGTTASLAVLAVGFQLATYRSPDITYSESTSNFTDPHHCSEYSNCDPCIQSEYCGFCYVDHEGFYNGSCVQTALEKSGSPNISVSDYGRCSTVNPQDHVTWAYDYCPTNISWMATFGLMLYLAFFAPGMGPMPWTINSEIYPLWARSTGNSISTATNWTFNLLIAMTFLTLTEELTRYGAFWLYTGFAFLGVVFIFSFLPETRGKSLEEVEDLFKKPWCSLRSQS